MKSTAFNHIATILTVVMLTLPGIGHGREVNSLSTSDGLSDMLVNVIYRDSIGFVWFGTETALDRFDGNNIKTYHFPEEIQGPRRVNTIIETKSGRMYVGNHQGLFTMSADRQQLERVCTKSINFPVNALAHDGKGILWVGTRQGLFRYNTLDNTIKTILLGSDILSQDNEVTGLHIDADSKGLWVASLVTLHYYDFGTGKISDFRSPEQGPVMRMTGIGDTIYLGTRGSGVVPFSKSRRRFMPHIELGNNIITSLCVDNDNNLIAVTDGEGIFSYSPSLGKVVTHMKASNSPMRSNSVYATYVDNTGLYWIGYYQGGVDYTLNTYELFDVYSHSGFLNTLDYEVRALAIDGDRRLIGTRDGLYYIDEATGKTAVFRKPQIDSNIIFCITRWNNMYYIGTYGGGVYVFDPTSLHINQLSTIGGDIFKDQTAFDITVDPSGNMWVGTSSGLYCFKDPIHSVHYDSTNSRLPEGNVYDIFFDSAGRGWISTENGMAIWDGSSLRTDRFPRGFINQQKIRDVFEDRDHNLYFAPDRGEVTKSNFEITKFGPIGINSKGLNVMTTFITEDNDGWIWFGTDKGLIRYDKKEKLQHFNNASGLPGLIFTLCPPYKDSKGDIWMGNTKGLLKLDFSKLREQAAELRPRLYVTDLASNGVSIHSRITSDRDGRQLTLSGDENDLEISFSNFNYISPEYCSVEYILEGYDDEWRITDGLHPIHYFGLPSGKYVLRIRQFGDPSTETAMLINKKSSLWTATYIIIAFVIMVIVLAVWMRTHRHHSHTPAEHDGNRQAGSENTAVVKKERYKTTRLSDEECRRLTKTLDQVMRDTKPYKNPDLKIGDLASMAGTTAHALSYIFNQYMQKSYYDYVNTYRVNEFKRLVKETDTSRYTLTGMAQMCGFSSRASFFRHFKTITGITPAEYLKR